MSKYQNLFPEKLFKMLNDVEREGLDKSVSWNEDGRSFTIHDPKLFARTTMKSHFNQTKYKSFQRQLNLYQFERSPIGPIRGVCKLPYSTILCDPFLDVRRICSHMISDKHKYFVKGNPSLLSHIRRAQRPKLTGGRPVTHVQSKCYIVDVQHNSITEKSTHATRQGM